MSSISTFQAISTSALLIEYHTEDACANKFVLQFGFFYFLFHNVLFSSIGFKSARFQFLLTVFVLYPRPSVISRFLGPFLSSFIELVMSGMRKCV